jgi:hypothetical protein
MTHTMTDHEATDEALLLFTRKTRRLHPEVFASVWTKIPEGARRALEAAERRADRLRDAHGGARGLEYPADPWDDEGDEDDE